MKIVVKDKIHKNLSPKDLIQRLLAKRKISNLTEFLSPTDPLELSLADFGHEKEAKKLSRLLGKIRKENQSVVVYTDYDADGITGGAILWETLYLLGFSVMPYVPHRQKEGYGFSKKGIDNVIKEFNPALIISVDHGITAVDQIAYAKSKGIKVVVTDHHHRQDKIPEDAEAIIHIPALSGSGVAYFVAKEIYTALRHSDPPTGKEESKKNRSFYSLPVGRQELRMTNVHEKLQYNFKHDYLSLASIGTIADLVPLVGPARSLAKYGLEQFGNTKRVGIKQLCKEARIENKTITPYEVGFIIAPRINAIGRLEHAIDALRLLCTKSEQRAVELSRSIGKKNTERQDMVKDAVRQAEEMVESKYSSSIPNILILHSPDWHEGIIGLIASRLVETYYRPTIIMSEVDGFLKGSARSIPAFHITKYFESIGDMFLNFGGHSQAAGFSLPKENLEEFMKTSLEHTAKAIKAEDLERVLEVDIELPLDLASMTLAKELLKLEPFGIGNARPLFVSDVIITGAQLFGSRKDHLRLFVKDIDGKRLFPFEVIGFGQAEMYSKLSRDQQVRLVYSLDIHNWNGRESLRGRLNHIEFE